MLPKKKIRSNQVQLRMFVDYMSKHKNFANGEFSGPMGSQQNARQWEELRLLLRDHGPDKSVEQWRHTWRDLKKKAREDGARSRKACTTTGNHVLEPKLSEISEKILCIIGSEIAFSKENAQESDIGSIAKSTGANEMSGESAQAVPPAPRSAPAVPPPATTAQQRRAGLWDRADEFLAAEQDTANVLRDIVKKLETQNKILKERNRLLMLQARMKNRQRLREARHRK